MQKILYFDERGFCTMRKDQNTIFTMFCEIPDELFDPVGIAIEEFVCEPRFKITNGRHINKGSVC